MTSQHPFQAARRVLEPRGFLLALVLLTPGCVTSQPFTNTQEPLPAGCQVVGFWDTRVHETQDVVNGGRPLPRQAGRVYLMNPLFKPEKGDGSLAVDLYDISNVPSGAQPKRLERWELDAATMAKLYRNDNKIGWGYTMFLPWATYRPDITRVQLNVCYIPAKGTPIYADPAPISLGSQVATTQTQKVMAPQRNP